jgi:hypothetical protein
LLVVSVYQNSPHLNLHTSLFESEDSRLFLTSRELLQSLLFFYLSVPLFADTMHQDNLWRHRAASVKADF